MVLPVFAVVRTWRRDPDPLSSSVVTVVELESKSVIDHSATPDVEISKTTITTILASNHRE